MTSQNNIWTKIAAFLANEMNDKQKNEFLMELESKQQLKNEYESMKYNWKQFNVSPDEKYKDTANAWKALNSRIQTEGLMESKTHQIRNSELHRLIRIAAIIVVILAVGVPSIYFSMQHTPGTAMIEHSSIEGVLTVDLPDGSRVFLNKGATLNYKKSFEEKREVNLKGEGFFNVMSDPKRPFNVNSGKVVVTVLGTSFNVKESRIKKKVEVFVESGSVKVSMNEINESITLEPGEIGTATSALSTSVLKDENYLSWKTKDFKFVDESIVDILNVLTQSYHVEVKSGDLSLEDMRLTTSYFDQSFDAILSTMCLALNMDYEKEGKVYTLHSK